MQTVLIQHDYPVPPVRLWRLVTDYGALRQICRRTIRFEALPSGQIEAGQVLDLRKSLFGLLPWRPCRMKVLECDHARMILRASERSIGARHLRHLQAVTPCDAGSRLTDRIEVEAGVLTPLAALWVHYLYAARHKPRAALLESGAF